jgi:Txe/YoeB family toxin of Txe-Axe toxin-antitoxin module
MKLATTLLTFTLCFGAFAQDEVKLDYLQKLTAGDQKKIGISSDDLRSIQSELENEAESPLKELHQKLSNSSKEEEASAQNELFHQEAMGLNGKVKALIDIVQNEPAFGYTNEKNEQLKKDMQDLKLRNHLLRIMALKIDQQSGNIDAGLFIEALNNTKENEELLLDIDELRILLLRNMNIESMIQDKAKDIAPIDSTQIKMDPLTDIEIGSETQKEIEEELGSSKEF